MSVSEKKLIFDDDDENDNDDGEKSNGKPLHNGFGPPFLSVGGLVTTGATLSGFYLFLELGYYYILFQHICAENYTNSILKETSIHV